MDYETQSLHQLRILAKDRANFGRINSATTGILIKVQDIEDESPEFVSVPSITRITEDVPTFTEVRSLFLFNIRTTFIEKWNLLSSKNTKSTNSHFQAKIRLEYETK